MKRARSTIERDRFFCVRSLGEGENRATWPCGLPGEMKNPRAVARTLIDTCSRDVCPSRRRDPWNIYYKARSKGESYAYFPRLIGLRSQHCSEKSNKRAPADARAYLDGSLLFRDSCAILSRSDRDIFGPKCRIFFRLIRGTRRGQRRLRVLISKIFFLIFIFNEIKQKVWRACFFSLAVCGAAQWVPRESYAYDFLRAFELQVRTENKN